MVKVKSDLLQMILKRFFQAFITTCPDNCESLEMGSDQSSLHWSQLVQDAAARLLMWTWKCECTSWKPDCTGFLPVLLLVFQVLNAKAPLAWHVICVWSVCVYLFVGVWSWVSSFWVWIFIIINIIIDAPINANMKQYPLYECNRTEKKEVHVCTSFLRQLTCEILRQWQPYCWAESWGPDLWSSPVIGTAKASD